MDNYIVLLMRDPTRATATLQREGLKDLTPGAWAVK